MHCIVPKCLLLKLCSLIRPDSGALSLFNFEPSAVSAGALHTLAHTIPAQPAPENTPQQRTFIYIDS